MGNGARKASFLVTAAEMNMGKTLGSMTRKWFGAGRDPSRSQPFSSKRERQFNVCPTERCKERIPPEWCGRIGCVVWVVGWPGGGPGEANLGGSCLYVMQNGNERGSRIEPSPLQLVQLNGAAFEGSKMQRTSCRIYLHEWKRLHM